MQFLVWIGAAISVAGLCGIIWSILQVQRARRAGIDDEALRLRMKEVLPLNLGALFASVLGLMLVIVGVILA